MERALLTLLVTSVILGACIFLLRSEEKRGERFLERFRAHADFWVLRVRHSSSVRMRLWSTYVIRETLQYFFHTILRGSIGTLRVLEERLKSILRRNRSLAKKSDIERKERNTLEELALHKMEVALSEKEKRIRRQKSLEG